MYTESYCVTQDHNLVDLWFLSLHCCFLFCIGDILEGMLVGCTWWCASRLSLFLFFSIRLFMFFLGLMVVVSGCSWGLLSTLDYVLSYLFSFI